MEIANDVREFLVGMKDTPLSIEEEELLTNLQDLHRDYIVMMKKFAIDVSELALHMSPEARMLAHELKLKVYQDWRAKLMEKIFVTSMTNQLEEEEQECNSKTSRNDGNKTNNNQCVCEMNERLKLYEKVIAEYIQASCKSKKRRKGTVIVGGRGGPSSPETPKRGRYCTAALSPETTFSTNGSESDTEEENIYEFQIPAFLCTPPLSLASTSSSSSSTSTMSSPPVSFSNFS